MTTTTHFRFLCQRWLCSISGASRLAAVYCKRQQSPFLFKPQDELSRVLDAENLYQLSIKFHLLSDVGSYSKSSFFSGFKSITLRISVLHKYYIAKDQLHHSRKRGNMSVKTHNNFPVSAQIKYWHLYKSWSQTFSWRFWFSLVPGR